MDRKGKKITTEKVDAIGRIGSQLLKVNTEANLRASERSPIRSATVVSPRLVHGRDTAFNYRCFVSR